MTDPTRSTGNPLSAAMLGIEQATGLDAAVGAAQPLMDAIDARPGLRDALQGRWLGHALHPLLVTVPLGTWLSALLLDATGSDEDAASLLVGAGLLSAVPSALTGWAELAPASPSEKRVGVVHAAANVAGLALQGASFVARRRGRRGAGAALSVAAMAATGAAGYLGGHLAVAREVGSKDPVFTDAP